MSATSDSTSMSLGEDRAEALVAALAGESPAPGVASSEARAPVHVVYGGAHLYREDTAAKLGSLARAAMSTWGDDDEEFAAIASAGASADRPRVDPAELARRVRDKLAREPIEKLCIDFEDGYGPRDDAEEDADAIRTATALASAGASAEASPPLVGVRIKALEAATVRRAVRTLDLFVTTLARASRSAGRALPPGFTVTLPKVSRPAEVAALEGLLAALEDALGLAKASIGIELMVETPRALLDADGRAALPALVAAAGGRCVAAHLGAYDLTASLGITAMEQRLDHPACDVARILMQLSLAPLGVTVVDGATTVLPIARHRGGAVAGAPLSPAQVQENRADVHDAWKMHASAIRRALALGIYQGWDLHPAQLPARYGATYAFFLADRAAMADRLRAFVAKATQATRSGRVFDDAATGQGLLELFVRGVACGAFGEEDVASTGLTLAELRARSFERIVHARSQVPR